MNQTELQERVIELAAKAKLDSWNSFVEELPVPAELFPALVTNRVELIKLAKPRGLSLEEVAALYKLIAGLMETNQALREHASNVATLVQDWLATQAGALTLARKVAAFARFQHDYVESEE